MLVLSRCLKQRRVGRGNAHPIVDFQPQLATALFDLSRIDHRLAKEERKRVARKNKHNHKWFEARVAFLSEQRRQVSISS